MTYSEKRVGCLHQKEINPNGKGDKMKTVELITRTGYSWRTSVSKHSTLESVCQYFLGQWFNISEYPKEKMDKVEGLRFWDENGDLVKELLP